MNPHYPVHGSMGNSGFYKGGSAPYKAICWSYIPLAYIGLMLGTSNLHRLLSHRMSSATGWPSPQPWSKPSARGCACQVEHRRFHASGRSGDVPRWIPMGFLWDFMKYHGIWLERIMGTVWINTWYVMATRHDWTSSMMGIGLATSSPKYLFKVVNY